jgi:hypothetical protein
MLHEFKHKIYGLKFLINELPSERVFVGKLKTSDLELPTEYDSYEDKWYFESTKEWVEDLPFGIYIGNDLDELIDSIKNDIKACFLKYIEGGGK